ncbi:MAG: hypothetical protein AAFY59_04270 [Pseudomonadota bacterium]
MQRLLGAVLAVVLGLGGAAVAQTPPKHFKNEWALGYYDADNQPTTALGAAEIVAFVRGPRDIVLEIGCRPVGEGLFYRLGSRGEKKDFAGPSLQPRVTVRDAGKVRFQRQLIEVNLRPRGFYQGPVIPVFQRSLQLGDRIVFQSQEDDFFATFSLIGSNDAINSLPCS